MTCPACGRPTVDDYRPFCSGRCADLDLSNWLNGQYRVPVQEAEDVENHSEMSQIPTSGPH